MEKSDEVNPFEVPFDLKLTQVEGRGEHKHPQSIASIFVEFKTVQSFSEKERVLEWNLPLVALQRKMFVVLILTLPNPLKISSVARMADSSCQKRASSMMSSTLL